MRHGYPEFLIRAMPLRAGRLSQKNVISKWATFLKNASTINTVSHFIRPCSSNQKKLHEKRTQKRRGEPFPPLIKPGFNTACPVESLARRHQSLRRRRRRVPRPKRPRVAVAGSGITSPERHILVISAAIPAPELNVEVSIELNINP